MSATASALALEAKTTLDNHTDSPSYMVSTQKDRFCFIVPSYEAESLLLRLNRKYVSFDEATFKSDVILIDRVYIDGYNRKGFVSLQSLRERDKFIWMCRKGLLKRKEIDRDVLYDSLEGDYNND
ncbi:hypothetical protein ABES36_14890 [Bacillus pseudomycoides]|uniref:hypothetical protein n=1 Tax=Bacillus pseudomycoides TaxID=64104 RepID=UPI003D1F6E9A